jgi:hypothetical protein
VKKQTKTKKKAPARPKYYWGVERNTLFNERIVLETVEWIGAHRFPLTILTREDARAYARGLRKSGYTARVVKIPANRLEAVK